MYQGKFSVTKPVQRRKIRSNGSQRDPVPFQEAKDPRHWHELWTSPLLTRHARLARNHATKE
jgi:hypothetical protein